MSCAASVAPFYSEGVHDSEMPTNAAASKGSPQSPTVAAVDSHCHCVSSHYAGKLSFLILSRIFYYLPLKDLLSSALVCRHWNAFLAYENSPVWKAHCERLLPQSALADSYLFSDVVTYKAKLRSFLHAWNSSDCSRNGYIKPNGFTFHRNPVAQSTDGVRSKRGFVRGRHAWELWWDGPLGTVAMVGVASKHAALQCPGYSPLLGSDEQGWAWNLVDNQLMHNGKSLGIYPAVNNPPKYSTGCRIRLILDCESHLVYFEKGDDFYGVAFQNLPPIRLYPCVTSVYGNSEVTVVYLGPPLDG